MVMSRRTGPTQRLATSEAVGISHRIHDSKVFANRRGNPPVRPWLNGRESLVVTT